MRKISESKSWKQLNEVLSSLTTSQRSKEAGDIFEHVCKYYLETAPQYQSKLKKVWLLKEVKEDLKRKLNLPDTDEGIDLIAETYDKEYWAIQSKYRSNPQDTLTIKGDLATFANLAFNNCKHIVHGLVLTTSDKPPLKTKLLKGVGFETLESFVSLDDNDYEGWKLITAKATGKIVIPKALSPRPHQTEAIKKTIEYFKTKERGKMIMPCGTGKSLTAFWIARKLNAKSILIAVPSLALLQQTLKVWTREYLIAGIRPDWLCVCSDQTVSDDQDDFVSNIYDLGIDVTTDKKDIRKFLTNKNNNLKIVFTTYQSGKVTAQGAKGFRFDLGIMDEAHKTVGHGEKPMAHLIHQKNIKIKNRLFMTATERLFRGDKDEYVSMDDPRDYGEIIYQLSFKAAIEMKPPIISDYKIITFGITAPEIEAVYNDNKFIQVKKEIDNITAREFATAIALRKAIRKLGIRNAISFHSSIKRANNFKKQQELISKVYKQYGTIKTFHVSGAMPTSQRASQMREFAEGKGLMTNARCLTEGVDLPAIDCVVFTDPKRSKVDIVQAAGRALRLSPGKKFGYILIPILISEDENATEAAKDTAFEDIVATVRALATQDTRIVDYLRAVSSGTIPKGGGSPVDGLTKLNVLTKVNEEEFNKSIQLEVWDRVAFGNWRAYEDTKLFVKKLGLKSRAEYSKKSKSKEFPKDIPKSPYQTYKEFKSWGEFLSTGYISLKLRKYKSYKEAKDFAQTLNLKNHKEWKNYTDNNSIPKNIRKYPTRYKEFEGWSIFLGNKEKILSYKDAKNYIKKYKLKNSVEWAKFTSKSTFPKNLPKHPDYTYKKDFEGWPIFLNSTKAIKRGAFKSYKKAKIFAQKLRLKNRGEWWSKAKNGELPIDLPATPNEVYKKEWESWGVFLGTGFIAHSERKYLNFNDAKKLLSKYKIKSNTHYRQLYKQFKDKLPANLSQHYSKNKNFKGIADLFSSGKRSSKFSKYASFKDAKIIVKKLKIQSQLDWRNLKIDLKRKYNLPSIPERQYNKDWKGWGDFLGTGRVANQLKNK